MIMGSLLIWEVIERAKIGRRRNNAARGRDRAQNPFILTIMLRDDKVRQTKIINWSMSQVPRAVHAFCNPLRYCIWLWSACSYMPMQQTTYSTSNFSELSKSNCFWASEVKERRRWWHPFCRLCLRMLRDWWWLPCPECFVTWSLCVVMSVQSPSSWLSASHHCDKDFIIFIYLHWSLLSWIMNALLKNTNFDHFWILHCC